MGLLRNRGWGSVGRRFICRYWGLWGYLKNYRPGQNCRGKDGHNWGATWIIAGSWGTYLEGIGSMEGYWDDVGGWLGHFKHVESYSRSSQNQE